jgi:predicted metal-dependent enzyme (double-stranded beta helix superfamily)
MIKLSYRPLGLGFSVAGGVLAGMLFKQVWKLLAGEEDAPKATDQERTWREVLLAAALQGAIFAVVKAAADRGGAKGVRRLTGAWPAG